MAERELTMNDAKVLHTFKVLRAEVIANQRETYDLLAQARMVPASAASRQADIDRLSRAAEFRAGQVRATEVLLDAIAELAPDPVAFRRAARS